MGTKEIPSQDWDGVCRRLTELRPEALLTVEVVRTDGQRDQIARNVPLHSISFEKTDGCSDQILIELGAGNEKPARHVIVEPIHILLRPAENGSYNPMEINAESGTTLLTFRPALRADFLEGVRA
jgi:hypothetical protein